MIVDDLGCQRRLAFRYSSDSEDYREAAAGLCQQVFILDESVMPIFPAGGFRTSIPNWPASTADGSADAVRQFVSLLSPTAELIVPKRNIKA